jgi:HEAT repeat protein
VGATSCAGPADPALSPEKVALMLQGDDTHPRDQIRALAPGVVPALVTLATSSADDYARYRAITLLGEVGCRETAPAVERLLADGDPLVRMYATVSIKTLLGAEATPTLVRMLKDTDRGVLKFAIKGLGEVGDESAMPELERFRRTTGEPWLREHAAKATAAIGKRTK